MVEVLIKNGKIEKNGWVEIPNYILNNLLKKNLEEILYNIDNKNSEITIDINVSKKEISAYKKDVKIQDRSILQFKKLEEKSKGKFIRFYFNRSKSLINFIDKTFNLLYDDVYKHLIFSINQEKNQNNKYIKIKIHNGEVILPKEIIEKMDISECVIIKSYSFIEQHDKNHKDEPDLLISFDKKFINIFKNYDIEKYKRRGIYKEINLNGSYNKIYLKKDTFKEFLNLEKKILISIRSLDDDDDKSIQFTLNKEYYEKFLVINNFSKQEIEKLYEKLTKGISSYFNHIKSFIEYILENEKLRKTNLYFSYIYEIFKNINIESYEFRSLNKRSFIKLEAYLYVINNKEIIISKCDNLDLNRYLNPIKIELDNIFNMGVYEFEKTFKNRFKIKMSDLLPYQELARFYDILKKIRILGYEKLSSSFVKEALSFNTMLSQNKYLILKNTSNLRIKDINKFCYIFSVYHAYQKYYVKNEFIDFKFFINHLLDFHDLKPIEFYTLTNITHQIIYHFQVNETIKHIKIHVEDQFENIEGFDKILNYIKNKIHSQINGKEKIEKIITKIKLTISFFENVSDSKFLKYLEWKTYKNIKTRDQISRTTDRIYTILDKTPIKSKELHEIIFELKENLTYIIENNNSSDEIIQYLTKIFKNDNKRYQNLSKVENYLNVNLKKWEIGKNDIDNIYQSIKRALNERKSQQTKLNEILKLCIEIVKNNFEIDPLKPNVLVSSIFSIFVLSLNLEKKISINSICNIDEIKHSIQVLRFDILKTLNSIRKSVTKIRINDFKLIDENIKIEFRNLLIYLTLIKDIRNIKINFTTKRINDLYNKLKFFGENEEFEKVMYCYSKDFKRLFYLIERKNIHKFYHLKFLLVKYFIIHEIIMKAIIKNKKIKKTDSILKIVLVETRKLKLNISKNTIRFYILYLLKKNEVSFNYNEGWKTIENI